MRIAFFSALVAMSMLPLLAQAQEQLKIEHAWAPPSLSQPNAVGFMKITAPEDDVLTGAHSSCCAAVELHTHAMQGDIIRMRRVARIPLPAGKTVALEPGGYHLMLIGLKKPAHDGDTISVTLEFAHAPDRQVTITVDRARLLEHIKSPKH